MSFTSVVFLVLFFPACVLINYFLAERYRNVFLCLASLIFYFWCGIRFLILLAVSSIFAYVLGLLIAGAKHTGAKRSLLILGIVVNIGVLFYYKYLFNILSAISPWIASVAGHEVILMAESPVLPLGISFYIFSLLSYLLDVYWGICEAQKNYLNIWLYVAFFPKVVQGPIVRYKDFKSQLHGRTVDLIGMNDGLERFIKGMFKKVMIADQLQNLVTYSFSNIDGVGTIPAWIGSIAYTLQLYYDFSGYSDMAIGLAQMLGFRFAENFEHPYTSDSVTVFWRRWHISLTTWFREYIYIPMGGNRRGNVYIHLIIIFFLTGLWHGGTWNFIVWGMWHGTFMLLERLRRNKKPWLPKPLRWLYTILVVNTGWVFFRADSLNTVLQYLIKMLVWDTTDGLLMLGEYRNYLAMFFVIALVFAFPVYGKVKAKVLSLGTGTKWEPAVRVGYSVGLLVAFLLSFCFAVSNGYTSFLYEVF